MHELLGDLVKDGTYRLNPYLSPRFCLFRQLNYLTSSQSILSILWLSSSILVSELLYLVDCLNTFSDRSSDYDCQKLFLNRL